MTETEQAVAADVPADSILERRPLEQHEPDRRPTQRRFARIGAALLTLVAVFAALGSWAPVRLSAAPRAEAAATSLALASAADGQLGSPLDRPLLLSPEGPRASSSDHATDGAVWALEPARRSGEQAILRGHTDYVNEVAFSPDGRTLASASWDGTVRLWGTRTHKQLGPPLRGHTDAVYAVALSPDGRTLASASDDETVRLWDTRAHKQRGRPLRGHIGRVDGVAFSPDGRTLASAGYDRTVRLWDARTHKQLGRPLRGHTDFVEGVAFSPDGRTLAGAGADETVRLWDARTHK